MTTGNMRFQLYAADYYKKMLDWLSTPTVEQTKKTTIMQALFPVGREILVTDTTARQPWTHHPGLDSQPAVVLATSWNYKKNTGSVTYRIGNPGSTGTVSYGYAPACYLDAGDYTILDGSSWSGTPRDHEFTKDYQPKDVYFFDCFDLSDKDHPAAITDSCGAYKVWAIEIGTYDWTPVAFTCSVNADTGVITFTGSTAGLTGTKDYVIIFRSYDDLEPCQKRWIVHADDTNTVGAAGVMANRWV